MVRYYDSLIMVKSEFRRDLNAAKFRTFHDVSNMKTVVTPLALILFLLSVVSAGEFNPEVNIGQELAAWKELSGIDGKTHSWTDVKEAKVVVVVFTCNGCPYAVDYERRIRDLSQRYLENDKVAIVAINSNAIEEDSIDAMRDRATKRAWKLQYLKDDEAKLAKAWGATRTPEFFVLNAKREVVYMGAMDDDTNEESATRNYVQQAIDATLLGKEPATQETVPIGCTIRFPKRRRS